MDAMLPFSKTDPMISEAIFAEISILVAEIFIQKLLGKIFLNSA